MNNPDQNKQGMVSVLNMSKFKDTVLFSICIRRFGNAARIKDMSALQAYMAAWKDDSTPTDETLATPFVTVTSDRVKSTKNLIQSDRLNRLNKAMNALKGQVEAMSIPSYFRAGMFVSKQSNVTAVEATLKNGWRAIEERELKAFIEGYPEDVAAAESLPVKKGGLGPLYNASDYPSQEDLRKMFAIEWYWMALSVPENIPDDLKAEANEKFKRRMEDAAAQIEQALRSELLELIAHAEERLTPVPGEKPKVFRESAIGNIVQFISTFDSRDVFSDDRLKLILEQTKKLLLDEKGNVTTSPQKLRDYPSVRETARAGFANIREQLDGLIQEQGRKLDLTD